MSETSDTQNYNDSEEVISPKRILILTAFVVVAGSLLTLIFVNGNFAVGFFIGGLLALINYYWLKTSLKKVFQVIAPIKEDEEFVKPRFFRRALYFSLSVSGNRFVSDLDAEIDSDRRGFSWNV